MKNKKIILASASPRRRELLGQIGFTFEVRPSHAEEVTTSSEPSGIVMELARLKANDIFEKLSKNEKKNAIVVGSDTVVALDGKVMGKPVDEEDAKRMLTALQGRCHQVYTGVTLIWQENGGEEAESTSLQRQEKVFYDETSVEVYPMTEEEIDTYVSRLECMDKAGAYGIQGFFAAHIKGINGDYNNVVGLPVGRLYQEMKSI